MRSNQGSADDVEKSVVHTAVVKSPLSSVAHPGAVATKLLQLSACRNAGNRSTSSSSTLVKTLTCGRSSARTVSASSVPEGRRDEHLSRQVRANLDGLFMGPEAGGVDTKEIATVGQVMEDEAPGFVARPFAPDRRRRRS
jgi:hypothetical protein